MYAFMQNEQSNSSLSIYKRLGLKSGKIGRPKSNNIGTHLRVKVIFHSLSVAQIRTLSKTTIVCFANKNNRLDGAHKSTISEKGFS